VSVPDFVISPDDPEEVELPALEEDEPQQPLPKTWWQHPFMKGFLYTLGALSALLIMSIFVTLLNLAWDDFKWLIDFAPD